MSAENQTQPVDQAQIDQLHSEIATLAEANRSIVEQNESLKEQNDLLKKILDQGGAKAPQAAKPAEKPKIPENAVFTLNKKKYQIRVSHFTIPGIGYRTAEEVLHDPKAQAELVKIGSGTIKEVV